MAGRWSTARFQARRAVVVGLVAGEHELSLELGAEGREVGVDRVAR